MIARIKGKRKMTALMIRVQKKMKEVKKLMALVRMRTFEAVLEMTVFVVLSA